MKAQDLARRIRCSNAVALLGAGLSYDAGMPLANELPPLLWTVLDRHPQVRSSLARAVGVPDAPGKSLVSDDPILMRNAFALVAGSSSASHCLQALFTALDQKRAQACSPTHDALAAMIHAGWIELAISLNWDSLLECAYSRVFGPSINCPRRRLYKPHGDVLDPVSHWVLPGQSIAMPDYLLGQLEALASDRPRILMVVGYSEADEAVVQQIVRPLEARWQVVRISPLASGNSNWKTSAESAMPELAALMVKEPVCPGWEFVSFARQRDLGPAISGERLGPADVSACPRIPQVDVLHQQLFHAHVARLEGETGSGKSISAYQASHDMMLEGFHVLRLTEPVDEAGALASFKKSQITAIFLVDDAQRYSGSFLRSLSEEAGPDRKVLIVGTTFSDPGPAVRLTATESVQAVASAFLLRRDVVLSHIRQHDPTVGDRYCEMPIERRIAYAQKEPTLWLFNYVLRGGYERVKHVLAEGRDADRADLLLLGIAALQTVMLDAPASREQLSSIAAAFGRSEEWIDASLLALTRRRQLLVSNGYRCLHLALAYRLLRHFADASPTPEHTQFRDFLRSLCRRDLSLRGIFWLLDSIWLGSSFGRHYLCLIDDDLLTSLTQRCFAAVDETERRDACVLLNHALHFVEHGHCRLVDHLDVLATWANQCAGIADYALAGVVNDAFNDDRGIAADLVDRIDIVHVVRRIDTIDPNNSNGYAHLLDRLYVAASKEKRLVIKELLAATDMQAWVSQFTRSALSSFAALVNILAYSDLSVAQQAVIAASDMLQSAFRDDAVSAFDDCRNLIDFALGRVGQILSGRRLRPDQRRLGKLLSHGIDPLRVAQQIVVDRPAWWERCSNLLSWLSDVNRISFIAIVDHVDLNELDRAIGVHWETPGRELRLLVSALHHARRNTRISQWVMRHADQIKKADPLLLTVAPELADVVRKRGGIVDLHGHNGRNWVLAAMALNQINKVNAEAAKHALSCSVEEMLKTLMEPQPIDRQVWVFLEFAWDVDSGIVRDVFSRIDWIVAKPKWLIWLRSIKSRKTVANLRQFAETRNIAIPPLAEACNPTLTKK